MSLVTAKFTHSYARIRFLNAYKQSAGFLWSAMHMERPGGVVGIRNKSSRRACTRTYIRKIETIQKGQI